MKKLTLHDLDLLTQFSDTNSVIWLRNKDYSKQLYLSSSFEKIWGYAIDTVYQHPHTVEKSVLPDEYSQMIVKQQKMRKHAGSRKNSDKLEQLNGNEIFWRIKAANGDIKYIFDHPFMLADKQGNLIGFGGIGGELTQEEWLQRLHNETTQAASKFHDNKEQILLALEKDLGYKISSVESTMHNTFSTTSFPALTQRELECLYYLKKGYSAKQTATILSVSPRTVEFHIINMREKTQTRSKLELLSKLGLDSGCNSSIN